MTWEDENGWKKTDYPNVKKGQWYVYLLICSDNSLYCGITNDLRKRMSTHAQGKGAKYTRGRLPVQLIYTEKVKSKSAALKREFQIKALPRRQKCNLIKEWPDMLIKTKENMRFDDAE